MFNLLSTDRCSKARRGRLTTGHGVIETPAFMPVGTQGSVKAISPRELHELERGDSIDYRSSTPHCISNVGDEPADYSGEHLSFVR